MFNFGAPLFWYKLIFMGELLLAEFFATYTLKKRSRFILRVSLCAVGAVAFAFLFPLLVFNTLYSSIMFMLFFAATLIGLKICYDESWINLMFCGLVAYTTQHIAYEFFNLFLTASGIGSINMYGSDDSAFIFGGNITEGMAALTVAVYVGFYAVVYWFAWAFIETKIRKQENLTLNNFYLLGWSALVIVIDIVLSAVVTYTDDASSSRTVTIAFIISNIISCFLALGLQFLMLGKNLIEKDLKTVRTLWRQDKARFEMTKENIELINVKCHDLKSQIRSLRNTEGLIDEEALDEMENAINIYGLSIKTGNDALDVILAEKYLLCEKNGIKLTCIIDGDKLDFISPTNLYSLFGNALQNAIEATLKISDSEKRIIRLKVVCVADVLAIHVENSVNEAQNIRFVNGLPQTTKEDKKEHGFGIRSIQLLTERFGGGMSVKTSKGLFHLDIVIPIPKEAVKEKNHD